MGMFFIYYIEMGVAILNGNVGCKYTEMGMLGRHSGSQRVCGGHEDQTPQDHN